MQFILKLYFIMYGQMKGVLKNVAYHSLEVVPWEGRCEEEIRPNFSTLSPHAWKRAIILEMFQ